MGLWDSVTGFFEDLGDFFSGKDFFECAGYAWNDMMQLASDVLTKNPGKRDIQRCLGKYIYDIHNLKCSSSIFVMCLFSLWLLPGQLRFAYGFDL